jgi:hypothetical protein
VTTPVLFIHGLWLHASSWNPWIQLFRDAGYEPQAPGWPGDADTVAASRANPDTIGDHGIDDVADRRWRRVIAVDGKMLRGSRLPDGTGPFCPRSTRRSGRDPRRPGRHSVTAGQAAVRSR